MGENSIPLSRIVRKRVSSARSGWIFRPLACLIKVGIRDSSLSSVLFMMALHPNESAFENLHLQQFWKVLESVCSSTLTHSKDGLV